jgi:hypothetical protein
LNRRAFLQLSSGALLTSAASGLVAQSTAPSIANEAGKLRIDGATYAWEYKLADDSFELLDSEGRAIVGGRLQPSVVIAPSNAPAARICTPGKALAPQIDGNRIRFQYEGVNGASSLSVVWRFDDNGVWTEPIVYESNASEDVVSLHYFTQSDGLKHTPSLLSSYFVVPGISEGPAISPILWNTVKLDESVWLGRGSFIPGLLQQWALPVHYFCGFSVRATGGDRDMFVTGRSDAFTLGLADLPNGDLFLQMYEGSASVWIDYRGDLWKNMRGPARMTLGATLYWAVAPDYYRSIAAYYEGLLRKGIIRKKDSSVKKTSILLTPEYCTWGAQRARKKDGELLDEASLREMYRDLKSSGMKAGLFSIDDKWEGTYGKLEHSAERFPHFEEFLDEVRADGHRIGIWAALMRCEHPADVGLTEENMLRMPDGRAYMVPNWGRPGYYILDFTQPVAEKVLVELVRKFMRRYRPDLVKFDFGYELPTVAAASPKDASLSGERLLMKGIDIVVKAMRRENPDVVVMYYNLSPLFVEYFDLHSPDDLFMVQGEYDIEANRRFYFSSLLGRLGVPTYGSSGYDWASSPNIWFDSAAVGTIGSLNDLVRDEEGEGPTPDLIARYNGVAQTLRPTNFFEIVPLGGVSQAPTRGAHARSWARIEGGELVLYAYRPPVAGEEYALAENTTDPRYESRIRDAISASAPVIVSSKTAESIVHSNVLAVVTYAPGDILIRRNFGKRAVILSHYLGGSVTRSTASIRDGLLKLQPAVRNDAGQPLEWMEIQIA